MRRILSLWFPNLPLDRLSRRGDPRTGGAFAIVARTGNTWRLTHLSADAQQAGLLAGLPVPDARAVCPELLTEPADPARETRLLHALHRWADTLSPVVALDEPDGLLLDISGCAHLFGGEEAMALHALDRLDEMNITARIGVADTRGCARALARFGEHDPEIAAPGECVAALQNIPVAGLDIDDRLVRELRQAGLETIGQLLPIKSPELSRRFGLTLTITLAGALGHTPDPVVATRPDPTCIAHMTLPEPVLHADDFNAVLAKLANSVCRRLQNMRMTARNYRFTIDCVDRDSHVLTAGFARPQSDPGAVARQFAHALDNLGVGFGADGFRLEAERMEPARPVQKTLENRTDTIETTADLITTLGNRLGFDRVRMFVSLDSHLPEREFTTVPAVSRERHAAWHDARRRRPVRLYRNPERLHALAPGRPPQRFTWRGTTHETHHARGPERLTGEWWRENATTVRDFWQVQTRDGPRLWLVNHPNRSRTDWFVAGRFA